MERSATLPLIQGWCRACLAVGLSAGSLVSKLRTKSFAPLLTPSQHFLLKSSLPVSMEALQAATGAQTAHLDLCQMNLSSDQWGN